MSDTVQNTTFEEKTQWLDVLLIWFAGIAAAMQFAKFSLSYPELLSYYQAGPTLTGASLSVVGIVGLIFGVSAGVIVGRIGYRSVLIGALLLGGAMSFLESLLPPFSMILAFRLIEGFSQLGVVVAAPTMIARLSGPHHRSITMGLWGTFFGVAFAVSGSLGEMILEQYGLHGLYFCHGILITGIAIVLWFRLDKNNPLYKKQPSSSETISLIKQMAQVYSNVRCLYPGLVFVFYTCMLVSLLTYIPGLLENESLKTLLRTLLPLMSICGTFLAGTLSQYVMRPQQVAMMAYACVVVIALVVSQLAPYPVAFSFAVAVLILFVGMIPGASMSMVPALARNPQEQAQSYGLIAQLGNLGASSGPPIFATVITQYSVTGMVVVIWTLCAFGLTFGFLSLRVKTPSH